MTQATGQIVRLVGLTLEVVCLMFWVFPAMSGLPRPLWLAGVALGFVLWLVGTIATRRVAADERSSPRSEEGRGPGGP